VNVYPALTYRDVKAALHWVEKAFGLQPRVFEVEGEDEVQHAMLIHGDGAVMVELERPEDQHGSHTARGWV